MIKSFKSSFKGSLKQRSSYRSWDEEPEDILLGDEINRSLSQEEATPLSPPPLSYCMDCFYLGSQNMSGKCFKGEGSLEAPIHNLWELTQENDKSLLRRNSSKKKHKPLAKAESVVESTPLDCETTQMVKFVQIRAEQDTLSIWECNANEKIIEFRMNRIATCGTYQKIPNAFAFSGKEEAHSDVYCHVFKCDSADRARSMAATLNKIFKYHHSRKLAQRQAASIDRLAGLENKAFSQ